MNGTLGYVRKWKRSSSGNCPALYLLDGDALTIEAGAAGRAMIVPEDSMVVVQGWRVEDLALRAQLRDLGLDEEAVMVPADVIAGLTLGHKAAA